MLLAKRKMITYLTKKKEMIKKQISIYEAMAEDERQMPEYREKARVTALNYEQHIHAYDNLITDIYLNKMNSVFWGE